MGIKYVTTGIFFLLLSITAFGQSKNYWQQRVEYQMSIDVDAKNHRFTGTQKVTYFNNSPDTLSRVFYHLYFNAFRPNSMMDVRSRTIVDPDRRVRDRISKLPKDEIGYHHINSLEQDGSKVSYSIDGTIMEVNLNEVILPDKKATFTMDFESQVPRQIRRSGWMNKEGVEFSMSQWYPKISEYDEDGWHPNPYVGREFYGVWGSFDVRIAIDSSYVIGATGYLQNAEEIGYGYAEDAEYRHSDSEKLTWHWKADHVHDFMWAADPDYVHTTARVPNGPKLHFLYQDTVASNVGENRRQQLKRNWQAMPELTVKAFEFMNNNFGVYPYDKFSVIQGGDGGMEYPMGTLITGNRSLQSLVGVTVHELIHNWFYGVLATNESRYPWMDEGFTTYASALTMDQLFNNNQRKYSHQRSYQSYYNMVESGEEEALDTHADHFNTNRAYGVASYSKGAVFLNQLHYIIGDEAFDHGMKQYFNTWKFKHPDGRDFLQVMEKQSGMILDWYYQYFIESTRTIDYGITSVIGDTASTYVTLKRHALMPMPIELMATYKDGSQQLFYMPLQIMRNIKPSAGSDVKRIIKEDWPWVRPTYTLAIQRPASQIKRLEIDPSMQMADVDRSNNVIVMEEYLQQKTAE